MPENDQERAERLERIVSAHTTITFEYGMLHSFVTTFGFYQAKLEDDKRILRNSDVARKTGYQEYKDDLVFACKSLGYLSGYYDKPHPRLRTLDAALRDPKLEDDLVSTGISREIVTKRFQDFVAHETSLCKEYFDRYRTLLQEFADVNEQRTQQIWEILFHKGMVERKPLTPEEGRLFNHIADMLSMDH